jgi:phage N-6-adenine-methyltransferase
MPINYINLSKNDEWYTPKYLVEYFGKFEYDPATTIEKATEFGIEHYDTIETNGLKSEWSIYKKIWLNPPFSLKKEFLIKAVETYNQVKNDIYICIPVNYLTTKQFHNIVKGCCIYLPNGRFKFEHINGVSSSPTLGCIVIKLADEWSLKTIKLEEINNSGDEE